MIKFSFEVPIAYMEKFDEVNDYHFILAHMLLKDRNYAAFYKKATKYKILDNGCAELGKSIDTPKLINLAKDFKVDVLVLPDVWMDGKKTYEQSIEALKTIYEKYPVMFKKLKFMFVPQGKSYKEFNDCLDKFTDASFKYGWYHNIILGLPYLTCAKIMNLYSPTNRDDDVTNSRIHLIQKIKYAPHKIHLLGAGFNFSSEISFMRHDELVVTADTSTPFILAKEGTKLGKHGLFGRKIGKAGTLDFYEKYDEELLRLSIYNAKVLKAFAKL